MNVVSLKTLKTNSASKDPKKAKSAKKDLKLLVDGKMLPEDQLDWATKEVGYKVING